MPSGVRPLPCGQDEVEAWELVDAKRQAQPGDIVVARKDEEVVLRIYNRDDKGPYLDAANEGYKRLRLKEGQIVGVVVYSGREHR